MRLMKLLGFALLTATLAAPQDLKSSKNFPPAKVPTLSLGFSIHPMDVTADPCNDFYQYACGTWMKENPIPADKSTWGRFNELDARNRAVLHGILEKTAANDPKRTPVEQKIGDYYASCLIVKAIDEKGLAPIQAELGRIANLKEKSQLAAEIAHLHNIGVNVLFNFGSDPDFKNASKVIAATDQGGIWPPDRDYYFKDDPTSQKQPEQYKQHV